MSKVSISLVLILMGRIKTAVEMILEFATAELSTAKSKNEEAHINAFMRDITELNNILITVDAITKDLSAPKVTSYSAPILIQETARNIKRRMHDVAAKRSFNKEVIDCFAEAAKIIQL